MMDAKITLYKDCKIEEGKGLIVDDITTYLSTLTKIEAPNFQYQKNDLTIDVKVNLSQMHLEAKALYNYNYVSITNFEYDSEGEVLNTGKTYYYFIRQKQWRGQSTLLLSLYMDTVNTYRPSSDFTFNKRTRIQRQHKDRYSKVTTEQGFTLTGKIVEYDSDLGKYVFEETYPSSKGKILNFSSGVGESPTPSDLIVFFTSTSSSFTIRVRYDSPVEFSIPCLLRYEAIIPNINTFSEGLKPVLYKNEEYFVKDKLDIGWNLVYRSGVNDSDPVDCYLFPDDPLQSKFVVTVPNITSGSIGVDPMIFSVCGNIFSEESQDSLSLDIDGTEYSLKYNRLIKNQLYTSPVIYIVKTGATLSVTYYLAQFELVAGALVFNNNISKMGELTGVNEVKVISSLDTIKYAKDMDHWTEPAYDFSNVTATNVLIDSINSLDKSDSRLIKVIKIPYAPTYISQDNLGYYSFDVAWEYDSGMKAMKLRNLNTLFTNSFESSFNPLEPLFYKSFTPSINDSRNDNMEPKIYHSDYYQPKAVYDSFYHIFELENVDETSLRPDSKFLVQFTPTSTINSKFLFQFPSYKLKRSTSDYDQLLLASRNNQVTVYSSPYLNYLRNGYNYDVKAKERQEIGTVLGMITGGVGAVASAGLGLASGNPSVAVGSMISGFSSLTNTIVNGINSMAQNEANLEQKLQQAKAQAVAVSGTDDLDLFVAYSGNRMKFTLYKCSEKIRSLLLDLFYFSGYATEEMGTPQMTSRAWFNYVACSLIADTITYIPENQLADLMAKYNDGVYFMHKNIISLVPTWDFDFTHENWEVSLL